MFKLDFSLKIGDILTSLTIIVSVSALLVSWSKDRYIKQKERADAVRTSVSIMIAKLDRWQSLKLSCFRELQPVFIETSEMLAGDFDIIKARDFLWKRINVIEKDIHAKILDERMETAYISLFSHYSAIRPLFLETITQLNESAEKIMGEFIENTQRDVMNFEKKKVGYTSAMLGNALRKSAENSKKNLENSINAIMAPIRSKLLQVVEKTDDEILKPDIVSDSNK